MDCRVKPGNDNPENGATKRQRNQPKENTIPASHEAGRNGVDL
jgi:hypothetical protein